MALGSTRKERAKEGTNRPQSLVNYEIERLPLLRMIAWGRHEWTSVTEDEERARLLLPSCGSGMQEANQGHLYP
jgi:hypothetical protein